MNNVNSQKFVPLFDIIFFQDSLSQTINPYYNSRRRICLHYLFSQAHTFQKFPLFYFPLEESIFANLQQSVWLLIYNNFTKEMSLKTNILRLQAQGICYSYCCHFSNQITDQDALQIQFHIESLDNNIIYSHPNLYTNQHINIDHLQVLLSKGQTIIVNIEFLKEIPKIQIIEDVCQKLLRGLQFMGYRKIRTYFNPFEEKDNVIPGLYLEPVYQNTYTGIAFLPVNLVLQPPVEISSSKILLNYTNGRFYERSEIVRVDKQKNLIHFRNSQSIPISSIRKGKIKDVSGLDLALRLRNYSQRIKQNNKQFFKNWGILLQGNFYNTSAQLISVGAISLRDNKQKALSQLVSPMARNSYNNNFRQVFKTPFQSDFSAQLIFLIPSQLSKQGKQLIHEFNKQSQKMSLTLKLSHINLHSLENQEQLQKVLTSSCYSKSSIYVLIVNKDDNRTNAQEENIKFFKSTMINKQLYFHVLEFGGEEDEAEVDVIAIRNLAVLFCKMRRIPWKIKNIPFGDKPTIACVIDVQEMIDGRFSVACVSTMNAFFSKFCCFISACQVDRIQSTIFTLVQQSLNKFCSAHKIYPFRIFLYRTGTSTDCEHQYQSITQKLRNFSTTLSLQSTPKLTYIQLQHTHPLRFYFQTDQNYISKLTVKKTQLLTSTTISGKYYVQLQFEKAPVQIKIYNHNHNHNDNDGNDPTFIPKVLEFTAKLCYGSVGNQFGKGIGMFGFAGKLNQYREYSLGKWDVILQEGVMLFI